MTKARQRARYSQEYKIAVVSYALALPATARVKPTCRNFPGIEPVQIRKWIRAFAPLIEQEQGSVTGNPIPSSPLPVHVERGLEEDVGVSSSEDEGKPIKLSRRPTELSTSSPTPSSVQSTQPFSPPPPATSPLVHHSAGYNASPTPTVSRDSPSSWQPSSSNLHLSPNLAWAQAVPVACAPDGSVPMAFRTGLMPAGLPPPFPANFSAFSIPQSVPLCTYGYPLPFYTAPKPFAALPPAAAPPPAAASPPAVEPQSEAAVAAHDLLFLRLGHPIALR